MTRCQSLKSINIEKKQLQLIHFYRKIFVKLYEEFRKYARLKENVSVSSAFKRP